MSRQPESRLQRRIREALEARFGGFWYKVWGGPYQPKGLPDLYGVFRRDGVVYPAHVEVKRPGEEPSPVQIHRMRQLADAGAVVCVATSAEEATRNVDLLTGPCNGARFCFSCMSVEFVAAYEVDRRGRRVRCRGCGGLM